MRPLERCPCSPCPSGSAVFRQRGARLPALRQAGRCAVRHDRRADRPQRARPGHVHAARQPRPRAAPGGPSAAGVPRRRAGPDEHRPHHGRDQALRRRARRPRPDRVLPARNGPSKITCPELERGDDPQTAVPACAQELGPARNFYTSRDAADDLDDIRQALGVDKVAIVTASYGTWVAQGYAIRHPQHVELMVLDSTYGPNQNADPFGTEQFSAGAGARQGAVPPGRVRGRSRRTRTPISPSCSPGSPRSPRSRSWSTRTGRTGRSRSARSRSPSCCPSST